MQILQVAQAEGIHLISDDYDYIVMGNIEEKAFTFRGMDKIDINDECVSFYKSQSINNVDDIVLSVNFGKEIVKRNSSSYWKSSFEVCQQIVSELY